MFVLLDGCAIDFWAQKFITYWFFSSKIYVTYFRAQKSILILKLLNRFLTCFHNIYLFQVSTNPEEPPESIYSLSDVSAGWYKFIEDYKHKFWYWGRLKRRWAYFWSMVKNSPEPFKVEVYYEQFCPGCKRCKMNKKLEEPKIQTQTQENQSWWRYFIGVPLIGTNKQPQKLSMCEKYQISKIVLIFSTQERLQ